MPRLVKRLVKTDPEEQKLVNHGRRLQREKDEEAAAEKKARELKADLRASDAENAELRDMVVHERQAGRASHRGLTWLGGAAGTGTGIALQHYVMDPMVAPPNWLKKGTIPTIGGVAGCLTLLLADGVIADALGGFLLGNALGSGSTSVTKKIASGT